MRKTLPSVSLAVIPGRGACLKKSTWGHHITTQKANRQRDLRAPHAHKKRDGRATRNFSFVCPLRGQLTHVVRVHVELCLLRFPVDCADGIPSTAAHCAAATTASLQRNCSPLHSSPHLNKRAYCRRGSGGCRSAL